MDCPGVEEDTRVGGSVVIQDFEIGRMNMIVVAFDTKTDKQIGFFCTSSSWSEALRSCGYVRLPPLGKTFKERQFSM